MKKFDVTGFETHVSIGHIRKFFLFTNNAQLNQLNYTEYGWLHKNALFWTFLNLGKELFRHKTNSLGLFCNARLLFSASYHITQSSRDRAWHGGVIFGLATKIAQSSEGKKDGDWYIYP